MTAGSFGLALLMLVGFGVVWYLLHYLLQPDLVNPDGFGRVTGNCGDTMEIGLRVEDGRVAETSAWTDGCNTSKQCVESAARLAMDKTVEELRRLQMIQIVDDVGPIPDSHLHCAQLAETTLQQALADYLASSRPGDVRQEA